MDVTVLDFLNVYAYKRAIMLDKTFISLDKFRIVNLFRFVGGGATMYSTFLVPGQLGP